MEETLVWIDSQYENMCHLVEEWANINSHSKNRQGLHTMQKHLLSEFVQLKPDEVNESEAGLHLRKRSKAPLQVFLGGHMDTVFSLDPLFQKVVPISSNRWQGPGVADMKGGLVILLKTLEAFERFSDASELGWEIFINTDEEIGSPTSSPFLEKYATRCHLALLFEPALEEGLLASARKGSSYYVVNSHGKAAHAGRDPEKGKNALYPLAKWVTEIESFIDLEKGISVNVGSIEGGSAANIVPDFARAHLNVRVKNEEQLKRIEKEMHTRAEKLGLELHLQSHRPPKPFDDKTRLLFEQLKGCADELGFKLEWKETGGVCDGNLIASKGIPTIDTLGVRGGNIHTEEESIELESLPERAKLTTLFLIKIARGEICLPQ